MLLPSSGRDTGDAVQQCASLCKVEKPWSRGLSGVSKGLECQAKEQHVFIKVVSGPVKGGTYSLCIRKLVLGFCFGQFNPREGLWVSMAPGLTEMMSLLWFRGPLSEQPSNHSGAKVMPWRPSTSGPCVSECSGLWPVLTSLAQRPPWQTSPCHGLEGHLRDREAALSQSCKMPGFQTINR